MPPRPGAAGVRRLLRTCEVRPIAEDDPGGGRELGPRAVIDLEPDPQLPEAGLRGPLRVEGAFKARAVQAEGRDPVVEHGALDLPDGADAPVVVEAPREVPAL